MKIRSITVFCAPGFPANRLLLQHMGIFANHARAVFTQEGFEVETLRLALPPFSSFIAPRQLVEAAQALSIEAHADGFDYLSLGPAQATDPDSYQRIPEALAATHGVFFSGMLTTPQGVVSLPAAKACARIIEQLAALSPDGFANLNFCASANVPAYAPFFPAAYAENAAPAAGGRHHLSAHPPADLLRGRAGRFPAGLSHAARGGSGADRKSIGDRL